jgi:RimJ/RimL family protein N-acetyltransferase
MPGPVFLAGDRPSLRTVEPDDYGFVHRHWNAPAIRHGTNRAVPRSREAIADFFVGDGYDVAFLPSVDGEPVGLTWPFRVDERSDRAEVGYWIAPDREGRGYATEAAGLAADCAFDERGLRKLVARVLEGNPASARVLGKVGFVEEATLRDHYHVDGDRVDATLYALFADERP